MKHKKTHTRNIFFANSSNVFFVKGILYYHPNHKMKWTKRDKLMNAASILHRLERSESSFPKMTPYGTSLIVQCSKNETNKKPGRTIHKNPIVGTTCRVRMPSARCAVAMDVISSLKKQIDNNHPSVRKERLRMDMMIVLSWMMHNHPFVAWKILHNTFDKYKYLRVVYCPSYLIPESEPVYEWMRSLVDKYYDQY